MPTYSVFKRHPILSLGLAQSLALIAALPAEALIHSHSRWQQPTTLNAQLWGQLDPHIADQVTAPRLYQVRLLQPLDSRQQARSTAAVHVMGGLPKAGNARDVTFRKAH